MVEPADHRLIVMRSRVDNTVFVVIIGQIIVLAAGIAGVEGKFQNLHIGIPCILHQFPDGIRDIAQILRDNRQTGYLFLDRPEKADSGALLPLSDPCVPALCRNRIILVKPAEMVDANNIKQTAAAPLIHHAYPVFS